MFDRLGIGEYFGIIILHGYNYPISGKSSSKNVFGEIVFLLGTLCLHHGLHWNNFKPESIDESSRLMFMLLENSIIKKTK